MEELSASPRVRAHNVSCVCAHDESHACGQMPRSAPKAKPQFLSTITQFAVELSCFWLRAQSVLRPGLELKLPSIQVHLDRLPLNLLLQLRLERGHPMRSLHPATSILLLVLVLGKKKPSISPSPKLYLILGGLGRTTRGELKKAPILLAGGWG